MDTHEAYRELGLLPSASDAQLKAAWRRLVSRWHPDRNPSQEAARRIQRINKAYDHLRRLREGGEEAAEGPPGSAGSAPPPPPPPQDPATPLTVHAVRLTIEEATLGCVRQLRGRLSRDCPDCAGQGRRVLSQNCPRCHGLGRRPKPALFGWLWSHDECPDCGGDGRRRERCAPCHGSGQRQLDYQRSVRIPPGVRDGTVLAVPPSQQDGLTLALELQLTLEPHPLFVLEDGQLRCDMPVDGHAWAANQWVEVPTPEGLQQMRLNRDALVYRLRGQGFPVAPRGPRGDYLVRIQPSFASQPDAEQLAALERLIEANARAADADAASPLGQWRQRLAQARPEAAAAQTAPAGKGRRKRR